MSKSETLLRQFVGGKTDRELVVLLMNLLKAVDNIHQDASGDQLCLQLSLEAMNAYREEILRRKDLGGTRIPYN